MARATHKGRGVSPAGLRRLLEAEIDRLIDMLDRMDGDENLEDGGDLEPSFGLSHYLNGKVELELEGDNADLEHSLGWISHEDGHIMAGYDPGEDLRTGPLGFNGDGAQHANAMLRRRKLPTVRLPAAYGRYVE